MVALAVTAGLTRSGPRSAASPAIGQHVGVPAYFSPASIGPGDCSRAGDGRTCTSPWAQLLDDDNPNLTFAVADIDSGPGLTPGPSPAVRAYQATIRAMDKGADPVKVLGYVDTGHLGSSGLTTRSGGSTVQDWVEQATHDVDAWYRQYGSAGLGGIFLDQGAGFSADGDVGCGVDGISIGDSYARAYLQLDQYVKVHHPGAFVVLNPGQTVPQCYQHAADVIVTFEGPAASYLTKVETGGTWHYPWQLTWTPASPDEIMHIVYGTAGQGALDQVMSLSKGNAGYVYVTDDSGVNPYDQLPGGFSPNPSSGKAPWNGYLARELADAQLMRAT